MSLAGPLTMEMDWRLRVAAAGLASAGIFYAGYRMGLLSTGTSAAPAKLTPIQRPHGKSYEKPGDPLTKYILEHNRDSVAALRKLRELSVSHEHGIFTTPIEEGKLLTMLVRALNAKKVIDIGVFTGCSAFAMALGLVEGGKVLACDISEEFTSLGRPYWVEGGVADKIDLCLQPAVKTLRELLDQGEAGSFDLVFIDADKERYFEYYEFGVTLLRRGGLMVVDNAVLHGRVADSEERDEKVVAIRRMNKAMSEDPRLDFVLLNFVDGLGIAQKL